MPRWKQKFVITSLGSSLPRTFLIKTRVKSDQFNFQAFQRFIFFAPLGIVIGLSRLRGFAYQTFKDFIDSRYKKIRKGYKMGQTPEGDRFRRAL